MTIFGYVQIGLYLLVLLLLVKPLGVLHGAGLPGREGFSFSSYPTGRAFRLPYCGYSAG